MGKRKDQTLISHTLPSSPSHSFSSSSSSDFEFTISLSPLKSSSSASSALCVADELFYKGQLLPLQLSPRLSMVRTLHASSSRDSSSSSDAATTSSRDSSGSSTDSHSSFSGGEAAVLIATVSRDCDSSRPSSVTEDEEFRRLHNGTNSDSNPHRQQIRKSRYFLSRFSSVFRKEQGRSRVETPYGLSGTSSSTPSVKKRVSATAKEVIRKYLKKVKPLYEKLSQKQQQQNNSKSRASPATAKGIDPTDVDGIYRARLSFSQPLRTERSVRELVFSSPAKTERSKPADGIVNNRAFSHSFSGNLRYPRKRSVASSCPSSMRSSPSHSGVLCRNGLSSARAGGGGGLSSEASSMEELQSAIQGAIAHCKKSMLQNKAMMVSNEI